MNYFSSKNPFRASITIGFLVALSQCTCAQSLEEEIRDLPSDDWVTLYWQLIDKTDQAHRGLRTIDSLDNDNFKRTILMIRYHGYPEGNNTPNRVFTHQRSAYVCEHYFPVFLDAFLNAKADTFWFMHNVLGLQRGRFARGFVEPDVSNYKTVLARMSRWVPKEVSYDLTPFDSLFTTYMRDVKRITGGEPVKQWRTKDNDRITWYRVDGMLYTYKFWRDGSYSTPQAIFLDPSDERYRYREEVPGTWLEIAADGSLVVFSDSHEQYRAAPDPTFKPR